jgi:hypothetical protein
MVENTLAFQLGRSILLQPTLLDESGDVVF